MCDMTRSYGGCLVKSYVVCAWESLYVRICASEWVSVFVSVFVCVCLCVCVRSYIRWSCEQLCAFVHANLSIHVHMSFNMYAHLYIHTKKTLARRTCPISPHEKTSGGKREDSVAWELYARPCLDIHRYIYELYINRHAYMYIYLWIKISRRTELADE